MSDVADDHRPPSAECTGASTLRGAHAQCAKWIGSRLAAVVMLLAATVPGPACASQRDVDAALEAMSGEIAEVKQSCNEPVSVSAREVALSDRVKGVHVVLTEGTCLGSFGQYDYLLIRHSDGHWQMVKSGNPGVLEFTRRLGQSVAEIGMRSLMGCTTTLTWTGMEYRQRASKACGDIHKAPEWSILERVIRASKK